MKTPGERISKIISTLFLSEPLYQHVALTHKLVVDNKIETISVGKMEMHYNPSFIDELSDSSLRLVLFNEFDRILLKHPYERRRKNGTALYNSSNLTLAEHGRDLGQVTIQEVYDYIRAKGMTEDQSKFIKMYESLADLSDEELMRKTGFTREKLNRIVTRIQLPTLEDMKKRHMEYYYNLLDKYLEPAAALAGLNGGDMGDQEGNGGSQGLNGKGRPGDADGGKDGNGKSGKDGNGDSDKNGSGNGNGERKGLDRYNHPKDPASLSENWEEDPLAENEIDNIIREAQMTGDWGTVGNHLKETLIASLKPKVNYKSILKQFRQRVLSSNTTLNRMRPNRRFGFGFPGRKHEYTTKLAFFVDTSASVASKSLADCIGTINNIFSYGVKEIDVYWFDTNIQNRKPISIKKVMKEIKVSGRGGTDFQSVFDFLAEKDAPSYDGIIVFTDGECYKPDLKGVAKNDICWLIDTESHYEECKSKLMDVGRVAFVQSVDEI